jgi:hypothetical protein
VRFSEGDVYEFSVSGLQQCSVAPTAGGDTWKAPYGPMKSVVTCSTAGFTMKMPLTVTWTMRYR